jgi:hypothetical protein
MICPSRANSKWRLGKRAPEAVGGRAAIYGREREHDKILFGAAAEPALSESEHQRVGVERARA